MLQSPSCIFDAAVGRGEVQVYGNTFFFDNDTHHHQQTWPHASWGEVVRIVMGNIPATEVLLVNRNFCSTFVYAIVLDSQVQSVTCSAKVVSYISFTQK